jgi:hypothetical protein
MKNLIKFFAVLLLVFGYTSCDELDKLTEFDIDTTLTGVIPVDVDGGENLVLNSSVRINIADGGQDIVDNLNKIEKVKINSLTYKVMNFSGDDAGVMTVELFADAVKLGEHTAVTVSSEVGVVYTINDTTTLNAIASKLKSGFDVVFKVEGTATSNPELGMMFDVEIKVDLEVTVDAG